MTYNGAAREQKSEKYYHFLVGGAIFLIAIIVLIVIMFGGNEKKNETGSTNNSADNQSQNEMKYSDSERQIREIKLNDKTIKECKESGDKIICKDIDGKESSYPRNLEQNFIY